MLWKRLSKLVAGEKPIHYHSQQSRQASQDCTFNPYPTVVGGSFHRYYPASFPSAFIL
jgi:hypothetical protein